MKQLKITAQGWGCALLLGGITLLAGCASTSTEEAPMAGLANPAAVYCEEIGGRTLIIANEQGQKGYCILPDGERVDQWDFYRLNHPES